MTNTVCALFMKLPVTHIVSNECMMVDNELERMCMKAVMVLSQNLLEGLGETMETSVRIVVATEIQIRHFLV
jgi:hypothetical protein